MTLNCWLGIPQEISLSKDKETEDYIYQQITEKEVMLDVLPAEERTPSWMLEMQEE